MNIEEVLDYIMNTPANTNLAVLKTLVSNEQWEKLCIYMSQTPYNANKAVLRGLLEKKEGQTAIVGTAVVGTSKVGGNV